MNRRICAWVLALVLLFSLSICPVSAAGDTEDTALRTVRALGILVGDEKGDLRLAENVTRAQFAKMMVVASGNGSGADSDPDTTLFRDVPGAHWAAGYIRRAVENGYFVGYSDGTFRPGNLITLEEACTAALRLLGYDSSSLTGAFPLAQLNKAQAVGLRDGLTAVRGEKMTRAMCVTLFDNLLTCATSGGPLYAQTCGYTLTDGKVDYLALVEQNMKGPFVCDGASPDLPFGEENLTVRRNGTVTDLQAVRRNDVYYYNENLRCVWAYSDRASGTLTAVEPSVSAPASAVVAGVRYPLSGEAALALSESGTFRKGDVVTLLLGRSGEAVAVLSAEESEWDYYGVARSVTRRTADGSASLVSEVVLICTDGKERSFRLESGSYTVGTVYRAAANGDGVALHAVPSKTVSGKVSSDGMMFAGYEIADDVRILEITGETVCQTVTAARLAGAALTDAHVKFWTLDENGRISDLILKDVTGDLWTYGILTEVKNSDLSDFNTGGRYTFLSDGTESTIALSGCQYQVETGGAAVLYENSQLKEMKNLQKVTVTDLSALWLRAGVQKYLLTDETQVYLRRSGHYYEVALSEIDTQNYSLTAWYDSLGFPAGGRVRVIVAVAK